MEREVGKGHRNGRISDVSIVSISDTNQLTIALFLINQLFILCILLLLIGTTMSKELEKNPNNNNNSGTNQKTTDPNTFNIGSIENANITASSERFNTNTNTNQNSTESNNNRPVTYNETFSPTQSYSQKRRGGTNCNTAAASTSTTATATAGGPTQSYTTRRKETNGHGSEDEAVQTNGSGITLQAQGDFKGGSSGDDDECAIVAVVNWKRPFPCGCSTSNNRKKLRRESDNVV